MSWLHPSFMCLVQDFFKVVFGHARKKKVMMPEVKNLLTTRLSSSMLQSIGRNSRLFQKSASAWGFWASFSMPGQNFQWHAKKTLCLQGRHSNFTLSLNAFGWESSWPSCLTWHSGSISSKVFQANFHYMKLKFIKSLRKQNGSGEIPFKLTSSLFFHFLWFMFSLVLRKGKVKRQKLKSSTVCYYEY